MTAEDQIDALLRRRGLLALTIAFVGALVAVGCLVPVFTGADLSDRAALVLTVATTIAIVLVIAGVGMSAKYARVLRIVSASPWRAVACTVTHERQGRQRWTVLSWGSVTLWPVNAAGELALDVGDVDLEIAGPTEGGQTFVVRRPGTRRFGVYRSR